MGTDSFAYKLFLLLHIASAIIGFGGVILNGVYAQRARKRPPAEALAVVEDNAWVSFKVAEIFIYLTAIFGFGLVGLSDEAVKFSQTWIWLAIVVYVVALGVSHGLLRPRVNRLIALMREVATGGAPAGGPPPQAAEMAKVGPQIGGLSTVLHLALAVILVLMVWKPGI